MSGATHLAAVAAKLRSPIAAAVAGAIVVGLLGACGGGEATENSPDGSPASVRTVELGATSLQPVTGTGDTYHVDTGGSDEADGSAESPWRTLQHAVDSVAPGDVIVVNEGTYRGARIERSGTADAWILLRAAQGAAVRIDEPGPENRHDSNLELETWEGDGIVAYWVVEGLEVTGAPSWGIDMRGSEEGHSHHFVIRGNRVHDNGVESGRTGIFAAFVDDVLIEGNESYANGEHGVYLSNSGDRFAVAGNALHDNEFCGLHMNGDESQGGDGVISDGVVAANTVYENGAQGCSGINMDGVTNTIVRNNVLYENHAGGISLFQENGAVCSRDNLVANNTILMADDGRWAINLSDESCTGNRLYNNIVLTRHEWRGSILLPSPDVEGFESDYNVVMDRFSADDDNSVIGLAEWQELGFDLNSVVAEPSDVFADAAAGDYTPRAGGPAVDAGIGLAEVATDIEGTERPAGGAFDIGAYELGAGAARPPEDATRSPASGTVTFEFEGSVYRLSLSEGSEPENVSARLDDLKPGSVAEALNVSPDGEWLVVVTDRFDAECADWACLALLPANLSEAEVIRAGGEAVHPASFSAVSSGGDLVVVAMSGGPNELDLWAIRREGGGWSEPELLTGDSPFAWNDQPAVSNDGTRVVFDCGPEPYGAEGTAICEAETDGSRFEVAVRPEEGPNGSSESALHHPDYAPDGGIVFEADWAAEQIWRKTPEGELELIGAEFSNDNSPCVLPGGEVVSLWLGREGSSGHELKLMLPDGSAHEMLFTEGDVADVGIGCGA